MALARFDERLGDAIQATIAYADLFDFPLEPEEVWRDLIGIAAGGTRSGRPSTRWRFRVSWRSMDRTSSCRAGWTWRRPGRSGADAARLWPVARRLGGLIGLLPFVRMVAATGSLAADNPDAAADLDYLIVTAPVGSGWSAPWRWRSCVSPAGKDPVCPNYLLTTRALTLDHQDLFTAHELLQAVPVFGRAVYREMLDQNSWSARWLPNRYRRGDGRDGRTPAHHPVQRIGEALLSGPVGGRLEAWEANRKRQRLGAVGGGARFTADTCEGHYGQHRRQIPRRT